MSAARDALPIALLACACGASLHATPTESHEARAIAVERPPPTVARAPVEQGAGGPDPSPRADALRARGASLAPGMRLVAEHASTDSAIDVLRADSQDECVRVAYDAPEPIVAELTDSKGDVLARSAAPASTGVLAAAGPVCVRRGDAVTAVALRSDDAGVRGPVLWAVWAAP